MKLRQAMALESKLIRKNGLIEKLIHACKKSISKNQSFTLTRELSINLKILPGKGKGNSIKLIVDKK